MSMEIVDTTRNDGATATPNAAQTPPLPLGKKKRSSMNLLRLALFMVRGRSGKKKAIVQYEIAQSSKKGIFNNFLGSVRPLHQLEHSPQPEQQQSLEPPTEEKESEPEAGSQASLPHREIYFPPPSPCGSEGWFSSDGMSRYASAEDLQALVNGCDEDIDERITASPHDIDLQAEEFIARFYKQMKLQRIDSFGYAEMKI